MLSRFMLANVLVSVDWGEAILGGWKRGMCGQAVLGPPASSAISLLSDCGQMGPLVWHLQNGDYLSSRVVTKAKLTMYA